MGLIQKSTALGNHEVSFREDTERYFKQGADKSRSIFSWKVSIIRNSSCNDCKQYL